MFNDKLINAVLSLKRSQKRLLSLLVDLFTIPFVLWLAFALRLDFSYIPGPAQYWIFIAAPAIAIPIFIRMGLYRAIIRYIGFHALWAILKSVALYSLIWSLVVLLAKVDGVPRSVFILNFILSILSVGGSRMVARYILSSFTPGTSKPGHLKRKKVVIYGAGAAGMQLAVALNQSKEFKPVAFI